MTIKEQIEHAFKYQYPILFQTHYVGRNEGLVTQCNSSGCVIECPDMPYHLSYDVLLCVCIPVKPPEKLILFHVGYEYYDLHENKYDKHPDTAHPVLCLLCGTETGSSQYRRMVPDDSFRYCNDCVTVVKWEDLMECYEKGVINDKDS